MTSTNTPTSIPKSASLGQLMSALGRALSAAKPPQDYKRYSEYQYMKELDGKGPYLVDQQGKPLMLSVDLVDSLLGQMRGIWFLTPSQRIFKKNLQNARYVLVMRDKPVRNETEVAPLLATPKPQPAG